MTPNKMTRLVRAASTVTLVATMLSACQTTASRNDAAVLKADEVRRLFVGNTVESHNLNTSFTSFTYYHPNGQAMQDRLWARRLGTWSVQNDGKICLAFGKREAKCRHIVSRDGKYFKIRPDEQGKPQEIIRYRYFSKGNALTEG